MMANCLFYVVPISLIGFIAAAVPAGAALRSDGDAGTPAAASAKSSDAPMMLAQRGGGRGGGGGARAGGGARVPAAGMPEERAAVTQAGPIAVLPPEAATGPAFPRATAASTPPTSTAPTSTPQTLTAMSTFRAAAITAAAIPVQVGVGSLPVSRRVPWSALPRPARLRRTTRLRRHPIARTRLSKLRALLTPARRRIPVVRPARRGASQGRLYGTTEDPAWVLPWSCCRCTMPDRQCRWVAPPIVSLTLVASRATRRPETGSGFSARAGEAASR